MHLPFLDVLRVGAMVLVVWAHLVGQFLERQGRSWLPLHYIERWVSDPAAIINFGGWIGVALFFLISGFTVSLAASSESAAQYAARRAVRIYPALAVAVFGAWALAHVRNHYAVVDTATGRVPEPSGVMAAVWNSTLINYVMVPQPIVLYVAWSLAVQVLFYALVLVLKPLLRFSGAISWGVLAIVFAAIVTARDYGDHYFLLVISLSYLPILVAGQALWLRWWHRIGTGQFALLTLTSWVIWTRGCEVLQPSFLPATYSYGVSLVIAYGVFLVALMRNAALRDTAVVTFLAKRSYSVYLLHGPLGLLVLDALNGRIPYTLALAVALTAVLLMAELTYRYVELPSRAWGRRVRKPKAAASTARFAPTSAEVVEGARAA